VLLPLWLLNVKRRMNATRVRRLRNEDSESDVLPRRAVKALGFFRHKADERKHGAATPSGKGLSVINLRQAWRRFITLKPSFLEIQVPKEGLSIINLRQAWRRFITLKPSVRGRTRRAPPGAVACRTDRRRSDPEENHGLWKRRCQRRRRRHPK